MLTDVTRLNFFEVARRAAFFSKQRQHLSAVKNRKLCGAALAQKGELCGDCAAFKANFLGPIGFSFVMMMWRIDLYDSC